MGPTPGLNQGSPCVTMSIEFWLSSNLPPLSRIFNA